MPLFLVIWTARLCRRGSRSASFVILFGLAVVLAFHPASADPARAEVSELAAGRWTGGAGIGFLGDTPDGIMELAIKGQADYFVTDRLSVGPLAQYAGTGNDFLFGLSAQAKYWWAVPNTANQVKFLVQGGLGFFRAGITDTDSGISKTYTSFVIPIGIGLDYAVTPRMALTADLLLNITSLGETVRANGREFDLHTNLMPGFYLGIRY
ncbi:MAG TPA: outer membrane beta-barrel protein [Nitrospiraceae bacterium]|nr:outer membrane beta-barrel protein [Nitrospiraceae bacterium]